MQIILKDKSGIPAITFSNFKKESNEEPIFISSQIHIHVNGFNATEEISIELSDLSEMQENLNVLKDTLKRTFYFQHIDERVKIKFEPTISGIINVTGNIKNADYTTNMDFKLEMELSSLPDLIKECNTVVERFSTSKPIDKYL